MLVCLLQVGFNLVCFALGFLLDCFLGFWLLLTVWIAFNLVGLALLLRVCCSHFEVCLHSAGLGGLFVVWGWLLLIWLLS